MALTGTDPHAQFDALPQRVFLDSSTLQTLLDYGGAVFEGEEPPPDSCAFRIPGFLDDLEALRLIFLVNERAMFDFVLSEGSLDEVVAKGDAELHPLGARRPRPLARPRRRVRGHGVRWNRGRCRCKGRDGEASGTSQVRTSASCVMRSHWSATPS